MKESGSGIGRIARAFRWSVSGLLKTYRNEEAFRQELYLCIVLVPLALYLGESGVEKSLMLGSLLLVLIVELLNSAVEVTVDRIGKENHELSGLAKDTGSAAVFLSLVNVVIVWLLVLFF